jgi:hypothetical protein
VGGLRAVFWHWAGDGLPLPQAKGPLTVALLVILFGPEPWQWDSGSFVLRGGVGRRNGRSHCWVRTPLRKIRRQFQGYKHLSLTSFVGESSRVRWFFVQKTKLVMLWWLGFASQLLSRIVIKTVGGVSVLFVRAYWRLRSLKQGFLVALWIINDLKW